MFLDDYENAKAKLRKAEVTSDVQTSQEDLLQRKRQKVKKFSFEESDSGDEESQSLLKLPPWLG